MKIKQKIVCAVVAVSLITSTVTAFGAGCHTYRRIAPYRGGYRVTYYKTCAKTKETANSSEAGPNTTVKKETSGKSAVSSEAYEVLNLVNKYRKENGLTALALNDNASKAANVRAEEISRSFSHTRPDGRAFYTALDTVGITKGSRGENIASGYKTAADVMSAWMNSSGHRANILSKSYKEIGVGIYRDGAGRLNWVQLFVG